MALGVFTPERPLKAVFREKLAYLKAPLGNPATVGGASDTSAEVVIDRVERSARTDVLATAFSTSGNRGP